MIDWTGVLICRGCGFITTEYVHENNHICMQCFQRRERRAGGGPLRVVTTGQTYHETPRCPAVRQASRWWFERDEECMYADMYDDGFSKCRRCHSASLYGFDHYRGEDMVIGHVG